MTEKSRLLFMTDKGAIGIGTPLAERPSHTTDRTDRVTSGAVRLLIDRMNREG